MTEMLRPMSTGELMDRTLVLYKKNFKLFVGIATLGPATYLLFQLLTIGSAAVPTVTPNKVNPFSSASAVMGLLAGLVIMLAGMAIAQGATVRAVAAVHLGLPMRITEAYRSLKGKILRILCVFFWMGFFAFVAAMGAVVLIAILTVALASLRLSASGKEGQIFAFVVGLGSVLLVGVSAMVVWVRYALAIACCVVEDLKVWKSIKRSAFLSKGSRFRIFLVYIVFVLLSALLGAGVGAVVGAAGSLIPSVTARLILIYLASFVIGTLTGPLATIGIALVYYDERVRKEAFDLQLMMSSLDPPAAPATAVVPVNP